MHDTRAFRRAPTTLQASTPADSPAVFPFAKPSNSSGIAVDIKGNVHVIDGGSLQDLLNFRVQRLSAPKPTSRDVALLGHGEDQKITFYEINGARQNGPAHDPSLRGADWENECDQQSIRRRRW